MIALLIFLSGQYRSGGGSVGELALRIADATLQLSFHEAISLGILCNLLVCLAVWMSFSARSTVERVVVIVPPSAAFVAAGFEHRIANMYLIPVGLMIRDWTPQTFWEKIGTNSETYSSLSWQGFLLNNLLPVTIGNLIGGAVLVGAVYWFIYLRHRMAT